MANHEVRWPLQSAGEANERPGRNERLAYAFHLNHNIKPAGPRAHLPVR